MDPVYVVSQQFLRVQSVSTAGTRHGDPADPVALEVVLTQGDREIDRVNKLSPSQKSLRRVRTGVWTYHLPESLLQAGLPYTVAWRYEMTPGAVNVTHQSVMWQPVPAVPSDPANTVLFGMLADTTGRPLSEQRLVLETYEDPRTLTHRTGQTEVRTDAFGIWHIEFPRGQVVRVVLNELSKLVQLPEDRGRIALKELAEYQPEQAEGLDRYGYPRP